MCDETFSINFSAKIPQDVDRGWFMFFVTLLNEFYWVSGATIGGLMGSLLTFDMQGISFVMTAMFTVIFLEQYEREHSHITAWVGLAGSALCLQLFGSQSFIIPAMLCILVVLTLIRGPLERKGI